MPGSGISASGGRFGPFWRSRQIKDQSTAGAYGRHRAGDLVQAVALRAHRLDSRSDQGREAVSGLPTGAAVGRDPLTAPGRLATRAGFSPAPPLQADSLHDQNGRERRGNPPFLGDFL
jgi:hypothetical protein